jgi:AmmeMemoRadiSam system protein A
LEVNPSEILTQNHQQLLLQLARHSIQMTIQKGRRLPSVESLSPLLREKRGVFVTLWTDELRGCIGFPYPVKPLGEAVQEAAISAALQDPRFPPVRAEELTRMEIEISVLSVPKPIEPPQVKIGVHGLIASRGKHSGLLLPQVALEYHWDVETFLGQTCVKAGLPPEAWKEKINLYGFEAQVFSERDMNKS